MSVSKKNKLLLRIFVPLDLVDPHEENPNKMTEREFDLLVQNVDGTGFTDPILLWPRDHIEALQQVIKDAKAAGITDLGRDEVNPDFAEMMRTAGIRFRNLAGHHRKEALQYLGETAAAATVILDPDFTDEDADTQLVKNNVIKGKIDPQKFVHMYERYAAKGYTQDVIQEMFGFAEEAEFKKLIQQTAKTLPKDLQQKFVEAAQEVKTIDGLSKLLNRMFTTYGDTLPYGYLVVDYGGQQSVWLRVSKKTFDSVTLIGQACVENGKALDDVLGYVLQSIAKGEASELIAAALDKAKPVVIPDGLVALPTHENLEKVSSL